MPLEVFKQCVDPAALNVLEYWHEGAEMELMFATEAIRQCGGERIALVLWGVPYDRMDRQFPDKLFTLPLFAKFVNWLRYEVVVLVEPHSGEAVMHFGNAVEMPLVEELLCDVIAHASYIRTIRQLNALCSKLLLDKLHRLPQAAFGRAVRSVFALRTAPVCRYEWGDAFMKKEILRASHLTLSRNADRILSGISFCSISIELPVSMAGVIPTTRESSRASSTSVRPNTS